MGVSEQLEKGGNGDGRDAGARTEVDIEIGAAVTELLGQIQAPARIDGPYRATLFESNGSVQTTVSKEVWARTELDLEELGKRDQYYMAEHGLVIIDLEDRFR